MTGKQKQLQYRGYKEKISRIKSETERLEQPAQVKTYKTVYEKIQWIVNKEGQATLVTQEIIAEPSEDGEPEKLMEYADTKIFEVMATANNSTHKYSYVDYIKLIRASGLVDFLRYGGHL